MAATIKEMGFQMNQKIASYLLALYTMDLVSTELIEDLQEELKGAELVRNNVKDRLNALKRAIKGRVAPEIFNNMEERVQICQSEMIYQLSSMVRVVFDLENDHRKHYFVSPEYKAGDIVEVDVNGDNRKGEVMKCVTHIESADEDIFEMKYHIALLDDKNNRTKTILYVEDDEINRFG